MREERAEKLRFWMQRSALLESGLSWGDLRLIPRDAIGAAFANRLRAK
jgi:hypothetical protein